MSRIILHNYLGRDRAVYGQINRKAPSRRFRAIDCGDDCECDHCKINRDAIPLNFRGEQSRAMRALSAAGFRGITEAMLESMGITSATLEGLRAAGKIKRRDVKMAAPAGLVVPWYYVDATRDAYAEVYEIRRGEKPGWFWVDENDKGNPHGPFKTSRLALNDAQSKGYMAETVNTGRARVPGW